MEKVVEILNDEGLHARPAGIFAKVAGEYQSEIELEFNGNKVNAKSVMTLMSLGLKKGAQIKIIAEGSDAEIALGALTTLVSNKFQS